MVELTARNGRSQLLAQLIVSVNQRRMGKIVLTTKEQPGSAESHKARLLKSPRADNNSQYCYLSLPKINFNLFGIMPTTHGHLSLSCLK